MHKINAFLAFTRGKSMANEVSKWDKASTIPLSELERYDYRARLDSSALKKIDQVFSSCLEKFHKMTAPDYFKEKLEGDHFTDSFRLNSMLIKEWDPQWQIRATRRTAIAEHPDLPNYIFKIYDSAPGKGHPMANTLRVPMSQKLQTAVVDCQLDQIVIPQKALIPLFPKEEIAELDENAINDAYIVMAEKMPMLSREEMFERAKKNETLPDQLCQLPIQTGYGDCCWTNFGLLPNGKTVVFDTEPLYWELGIQTEESNEKFERNFTIITSKDSTLKKCALRGLEELRRSSQENDLHTYEDAAQRQIDKVLTY